MASVIRCCAKVLIALLTEQLISPPMDGRVIVVGTLCIGLIAYGAGDFFVALYVVMVLFFLIERTITEFAFMGTMDARMFVEMLLQCGVRSETFVAL